MGLSGKVLGPLLVSGPAYLNNLCNISLFMCGAPIKIVIHHF